MRARQIDCTNGIRRLAEKAQFGHCRGKPRHWEIVIVCPLVWCRHPISSTRDIFTLRRPDEDALKRLRKSILILEFARKSVAARANNGSRRRIFHNCRKRVTEALDIVHILDRDATIAMRQPLMILEACE